MFKGQKLRNDFQKPLNTCSTDVKNEFLEKFLLWLDAWHSKNNGKLSKEIIHCALVQTTSGILELTEYCVNVLGMSMYCWQVPNRCFRSFVWTESPVGWWIISYLC